MSIGASFCCSYKELVDGPSFVAWRTVDPLRWTPDTGFLGAIPVQKLRCGNKMQIMAGFKVRGTIKFNYVHRIIYNCLQELYN